MLRREGYGGSITMLSADRALPYDRPNLSKGFLSGSAPEGSTICCGRRAMTRGGIDLVLDARVAEIDKAARIRVVGERGGQYKYDDLLLATGCEPIRLAVPGAELNHVHYSRNFDDAEALVAKVLVAPGGDHWGWLHRSRRSPPHSGPVTWKSMSWQRTQS